MAIEAIDWLVPPATPNGDDATTYVMGAAFEVEETLPCPGVQWVVPSVLTPPAGGVWYASLWEGTSRVRNLVIDPTGLEGQAAEFLWGDGPYSCTAGPEYTIQVLTRTYSFTGGGGYPYSTPAGNANATDGRLSTSSDPATRAAGGSAARFYVSPLLGEDLPGDDITAELVLSGPALAVALSAKTEVVAALALTAPALAAQLAAAAPIVATLDLTTPALDAALSVATDGDVVAMGLRAAMNEIAGVLRGADLGLTTVHAAPPGSLTAPAAVVTYPEQIIPHMTMGPRSVQKYERLAVWAVAGSVNGKPKTVQRLLSAWATGIPDALGAHQFTSCDVVALVDAESGVISIAGIDYLAIAFYLDVWGYRVETA